MISSEHLASLVGVGMVIFALLLLGLEFMGHGSLPAKKFELLLMIGGSMVAGHEIKKLITIRIAESGGSAPDQRPPRRDSAREDRPRERRSESERERWRSDHPDSDNDWTNGGNHE